jgi:hypothetical protein
MSGARNMLVTGLGSLLGERKQKRKGVEGNLWETVPIGTSIAKTNMVWCLISADMSPWKRQQAENRIL